MECKMPREFSVHDARSSQPFDGQSVHRVDRDDHDDVHGDGDDVCVSSVCGLQCLLFLCEVSNHKLHLS